MTEFIHHPSNHGYQTGKTLTAKSPSTPVNSKPLIVKPPLNPTNTKPLIVKPPLNPTNTKPLIVKSANTPWSPNCPELWKSTRPIAESILACLKEDLPEEYQAEIRPRSDGHCDIDINLGSPDRKQSIKMIPGSAIDEEGYSVLFRSWMFTLAIIGSNLTLVRNHDGDEILDMGFVLEDPNVFVKIVQIIKDWTVLTYNE